MQSEEPTVTYSIKELFDNQNKVISDQNKAIADQSKAIADLRTHVDNKFNWLLGITIACFLGLATLMFTLHIRIDSKLDRVIDKVHENDKRITILENKE